MWRCPQIVAAAGTFPFPRNPALACLFQEVVNRPCDWGDQEQQYPRCARAFRHEFKERARPNRQESPKYKRYDPPQDRYSCDHIEHAAFKARVDDAIQRKHGIRSGERPTDQSIAYAKAQSQPPQHIRGTALTYVQGATKGR